MTNISTANIPYEEYQAIATLIAQHRKEHNGNLRAVLVFGELLATGQSHDIQILEVVENWSGPLYHAFSSSAELPLRGTLHLYFLTPEGFENPLTISANKDASGVDLLRRILPAFSVIYDSPRGYALNVLSDLESRFFLPSSPDEDSQAQTGPVTFVKQINKRQATT